MANTKEMNTNMKTIDDIVETLTDEEKILFKNLIDECKERERFLTENKKNLNTEMLKLTQATEKLMVNLKKFHMTTVELQKVCKDAFTKLNTNVLEKIDDNMFFNA